jgi:hypothetical protein
MGGFQIVADNFYLVSDLCNKIIFKQFGVWAAYEQAILNPHQKFVNLWIDSKWR